MSYNQTREERIKALRERFGKKLVAKASTHTVDDIIQDLNKREMDNEAKQYDEAKEFTEHQEHNEYK